MQILTTYISIVYFISMITMSVLVLRDYRVQMWWLLPPALLAAWDFAMGFVLSPVYWPLSVFTAFVGLGIWLVKRYQERQDVARRIADDFWGRPPRDQG